MHSTNNAALVMVLALSAATAPAATAADFEYDKLGGIIGHQFTNQVFSTEGASNVECKMTTASGKIGERHLNFHVSSVKVVYSGCTTLFGLYSARVSEADYALHIGASTSEGYVTVENTIEISAAGCRITIAPASNSKLQTVAYRNNSGKVIEETNITGIESTTEGSEEVCGEDGTHANGSYSGNNEVELVGDAISVK